MVFWDLLFLLALLLWHVGSCSLPVKAWHNCLTLATAYPLHREAVWPTLPPKSCPMSQLEAMV